MSLQTKRENSADISVSLRVTAGLTAGRIRAWAREARQRLPKRSGRLSIVFVGSRESRKLNHSYRGKNKPTNVLSWLWPKTEQPVGEREWGEIILCPEVIRREAPLYERSYQEHTRRLIEHGMIHLLGLDHETRAEQQRWSRYERRLQ